jgi:hypothetical protein
MDGHRRPAGDQVGLPPLLAPEPGALTAADGVGQGSVILSHRPEANIQIATSLTKTRLS